MRKEKFLGIAKELSERFKDIPRVWDGRKAILEMKEEGYPHWRQTEWVGFYLSKYPEALPRLG